MEGMVGGVGAWWEGMEGMVGGDGGDVVDGVDGGRRWKGGRKMKSALDLDAMGEERRGQFGVRARGKGALVLCAVVVILRSTSGVHCAR
eukprot:364539-Chlamydomonas_euryale.AAC.4